MPKELTWEQEDVDRFMRSVDVLPCGCWFFTGARSRGKGNRKWYGSFHVKGHGTVRAHRFSDRALGGRPELPPGWHRDHTCCFSMCVNPDHLEQVTHEENERRKKERRRRRPMRSPLFYGHGPFTRPANAGMMALDGRRRAGPRSWRPSTWQTTHSA